MKLNDMFYDLLSLAKQESEPNRYAHSEEYDKLHDELDRKTMMVDELEENLSGYSLDVVLYIFDIINLKGYEDYIFEQIEEYESYKENMNRVYKDQITIDWEDKKQLLELRLYTREEFDIMLNILFKRKIKDKAKIKKQFLNKVIQKKG